MIADKPFTCDQATDALTQAFRTQHISQLTMSDKNKYEAASLCGLSCGCGILGGVAGWSLAMKIPVRISQDIGISQDMNIPAPITGVSKDICGIQEYWRELSLGLGLVAVGMIGVSTYLLVKDSDGNNDNPEGEEVDEDFDKDKKSEEDEEKETTDPGEKNKFEEAMDDTKEKLEDAGDDIKKKFRKVE